MVVISLRLVETSDDLEDEFMELVKKAGITSNPVLERDYEDVEATLLAPKEAVAAFEASLAGTTFLIEEMKDGPVIELGRLGRRPIKDGQVTIEQRIVPGGHGSDDYEKDHGMALRIDADDGTGPVGSVYLNVTDEVVHVRFLEVSEDRRRHAIGTALLDEVEARYGYWSANGFTDLGTALMDSRG